MNERIRYIVEKIKGPRVLDIGAASGLPDPSRDNWLHGHIKRKFPETVGIDLHGENVKTLRGLGWTDIIEGNAETYRPAERFDTIVAGELIEHLDSPVRFLQNVRPLLAEHGVLILSTPNPFCLLHIGFALRHCPRTCVHPAHTLWFCPTTLAQLASRAGYDTRSSKFVMNLGKSPSVAYQAYVWLIKLFGWMLPKVLKCDSFVCILDA